MSRNTLNMLKASIISWTIAIIYGIYKNNQSILIGSTVMLLIFVIAYLYEKGR